MEDLKAIRFVEGTKISHDCMDSTVNTFSYRTLVEKQIPAIGIPAKQNGLIIIDVDAGGASHKYDGREWWAYFHTTNGMPPTYTVTTPSGGYHYYFKLPVSVNPDTFFPPGQLAPGVDVKYNGWVAAPPTQGYMPCWGTIADIATAPPSLMMEFDSRRRNNEVKTFDYTEESMNAVAQMHQPLSEWQIKKLGEDLTFLQQKGFTISYQEWRDGLFSMKSGIYDDETLRDYVTKWTNNNSYVSGDEHKALEIVERASRHGRIGPGSIFNLITNIMTREQIPALAVTPFSKQEILDASKVRYKIEGEGIKIEASESNCAYIIRSLIEDKDLYLDVRQNLIIFKGRPTPEDEVLNLLMPMLQSDAYGMGLPKFKKSIVQTGLDIILNMRRRDPHIEWLKSLKWDGVERLERFFPDYVGVPDSMYHRQVGKNFWISMAARALNPGCKVDSMVVLEGREGIRKSSLVKAIGGEYTFAPSNTKVMEDTDELRKMHQSIIVELPELMGLTGRDSNTVKAFLSKESDHIRGLYERRAFPNKRGFVFVGTTNNKKYLSFEMGVRRFWPIEIPDQIEHIDLWKIEEDREQLFAEACHRFNAGEKFHEVPDIEHKKIVRARINIDPLEGPCLNIIADIGDNFKLSDIYTRLELSGLISKGLTPSMAKRIEIVLIGLGCEEIDTDRGLMWRLKNFNIESFI